MNNHYIDTPEHRERRRQLVALIRRKGITDERVLDAIDAIPRHFFMAPEDDEYAYEDRAYPIQEGQTISQPFTVAYQTQLLDVQPQHSVLEIGTGSAYQAAVLALLGAQIYSLERQKVLYELNQGKDFLATFSNLHLFYGDGFQGLPQFAPFDRILITAAAPYIPDALVEQLKAGGKMVLPLGREYPQRMVRLTKDNEGAVSMESFENFHFVPMLKGRSE